MKRQLPIKRNFALVRCILLFIITAIMFFTLYFLDQPSSLNHVNRTINHPMMYLCLLISFLSSFLIIYASGGFKKENINRRQSSHKIENNKHENQKPPLRFNSKGAYICFLFLSIPLQTLLFLYFVYGELVPYFFGKQNIAENESVLYLCWLLAIAISLSVHRYIGAFKFNQIITTIQQKKK